MNDTVLMEVREKLAIISLNRPQVLNAVNPRLIEGLHAAVRIATDDPEVRVIVLRGEGRAFCSGDDLKEARPPLEGDGPRYLQKLQDISRLLISTDKIVIGAIHGWAVGAGFEWTLNCDFTIWASNAVAFCPEVRWGLCATGGATAILPRLVGIAKAKEILILGERLPAAELQRLGLAYRVVPEGTVLENVHTLADEILKLSARSAAETKRIIRKVTLGELETALDLETQAILKSATDDDVAARLRQFE